MNDVLLISSGLINPPLKARLLLRKFLKEIRYIDLHYAGELNEKTAGLLAAYDAVILYHGKKEVKLTEKAEKALKKYVKRGGGLMTLHSATASYASSEAFFSITGGRFIESSGVQNFRMKPRTDASKMFSDFPVFKIRDEIYIHDFKEKVKIQMTADINGKEVPVVWTRKRGEGRVCCINLGHLPGTFELFEIRRLISAGLSYILKPKKKK
ncbi:MAG: ThuA domain-containing protein [Spirochaetales bacterium]|uniref:ThuA domain-containing protein n=1 Tax=Candidatus Thalassospirochaeta sargassi TaxID=3119039 RepID=A0AAJ1MNM9_9SPIO|nr:ThuA domain-containing protein [Spirochaetales bacterium]